MAEPRVECPKCGHKFAVTKALTDQIESTLRIEFDRDIKAREEDLELEYKDRLESAQDAAVAKALKAAEKGNLAERKELEKQLAAAEKREKAQKKEFDLRLKEEKDRLIKEAKKEVEGSFAKEIKDLQSKLRVSKKQVKGMEEKEAELEAMAEEIEQREKSLKDQIKRETDKVRKATEAAVAKRIAEDYHEQELQQQKIVADLRKQLTAVKSKLDQRSQELQGEVTELEFEKILKNTYPDDIISPVKKGARGGDIIQKVVSPNGRECGVILWEMKNAKNWAKTWVTKLKSDQRRIKAEIAVLVSKVLPKDLHGSFGQYEGVWVCEHSVAPGLVVALRSNLIEVSRVKSTSEGKDEKMEVLYQYLMSPDFRQRVEAIVEAFEEMKKDLDKERNAMERTWAKREQQIQQVVRNVSGMVGDIQAITREFPRIKRLELPAPD